MISFIDNVFEFIATNEFFAKFFIQEAFSSKATIENSFDSIPSIKRCASEPLPFKSNKFSDDTLEGLNSIILTNDYCDYSSDEDYDNTFDGFNSIFLTGEYSDDESDYSSKDNK